MGCREDSLLRISDVMAEYSIRIEGRNFAHLFKNRAPADDWSQSPLTAWGAIDARHMLLAESDPQEIVRAWVNSNVRTWNRECEEESRKRNLKDEGGGLIFGIAQSKSPPRDIAEASFRPKSRRISVVT